MKLINERDLKADIARLEQELYALKQKVRDIEERLGHDEDAISTLGTMVAIEYDS